MSNDVLGPVEGLWPGVAGIAADAAIWCLTCARKQYGEAAVQIVIDGSIAEDAEGYPHDGEGNPLHAVLTTEEWDGGASCNADGCGVSIDVIDEDVVDDGPCDLVAAVRRATHNRETMFWNAEGGTGYLTLCREARLSQANALTYDVLVLYHIDTSTERSFTDHEMTFACDNPEPVIEAITRDYGATNSWY